MHDCKHALYPNQVSPRRLISPRKLVTNPRQRVGRGGRTKEKSCHERTGWWCWWQWWWRKKSLPISGLCRLSLSLSPTPLNVSPLLLFFFLSLRGYLQYTLSLYQVAALRLVLPLWGKSQPQLSRPCFTTANEASKKKKTNKVVKYFCLPPPPKKKKPHACTEIQAALVLFLSSAVLSGKVLLKKPGELESDMMFSSRPAPPGCTEAAQEHARH